MSQLPKNSQLKSDQLKTSTWPAKEHKPASQLQNIPNQHILFFPTTLVINQSMISKDNMTMKTGVTADKYSDLYHWIKLYFKVYQLCIIAYMYNTSDAD